MKRPCLLVNPRSFRASRMGLAQRASRLAQAEGLDVYEVFDPPSLYARLDQLRERGVDQIWVLAGDGTLHALAEYMASVVGLWSPALLLLAGGRANVVPREVDGYPAMPALRRALAALRAGRSLAEDQLFTLQVSQSGSSTRQGFLFAGALVHEAVKLTAANRAAGKGWWRHSWFSDPFILLRWAVQTLVFRRPLPTCLATARVTGGQNLTGPTRLLIASTLLMRKALYNPFAARGSGPVRFTAVASAAPPNWKLLPALLSGNFDASMDVANGILSGRCESAELLGIDGYALDGELFRADPALPLIFTAGVALRVLRPAP